MQPNLDVFSLDGRTIALPVPSSQGSSVFKTKSASSVGFEQVRKSACTSTGEQLAWLAVAGSAVAALGLSFWF
jgi:hypothetical protein